VRVGLFSLLTIFFLSNFNSTKAQEDSLSTSISPVTFELNANPGETITNIVKVSNLSTIKQSYVMEVEPFIGNELGQATVVNSENDPQPELALKEWVSLTPAKFSLAPKAQQLITVTITIPKNAEPGGRYGTILAGTDHSNDAVDGTGAKVGQKLGTLVLLRVQGAIVYQAYLKDFSTTKLLYEQSPVTFSTRLHNDSTVHIKPKGFITITNLSGKKVVEQAFEERNVLPDGDRLISTEIKERLGMNRYTATLSLVYGDRNEQLISTTSFFIIPWKTAVPVSLGILIVLWFLIARRRRIGAALRILVGKQ